MKKTNKPLVLPLFISLLFSLMIFYHTPTNASVGAVKMVADLNKTQVDLMSSSGPFAFFDFQGELFFSANDGNHGNELWKYDGVNSPQKVDLPISLSVNFYPEHVTKYNSKLYFTPSFSRGEGLIECDGLNNCNQLTEDGFGHDIEDIVVFNSDLYILGDYTLYKYVEGIGLERVLENSTLTSSIQSKLVVFNSQLYFAAYEKRVTGNALKLWAMDESENIHLIADNNKNGFSDIVNLIVHNSGKADEKLIVEIENDARQHEIHYLSTEPNADFVKFADAYTVSKGEEPVAVSFNDNFYFSSGTDVGKVLFEYDFRNAPRMLLLENQSELLNTESLVVFNGTLYISATNDSQEPLKLYEYDGNGPIKRANLTEGNTCDWPRHLFVHNSYIYYSGWDEEKQTELCRYNTFSAPEMVADINTRNSGLNFHEITVANNKLFFLTSDENFFKRSMWSYDGVSKPKRITTQFLASEETLSELTPYQSKLFFLRDKSNSSMNELWSFDSQGELAEAKITHQHGISRIKNLHVHNGKLYFVSLSGPDLSGTLYEFDGKSSLRPIANLGETDSDEVVYGSLKDVLYIAKKSWYREGSYLWKYSGQGAGQRIEGIGEPIDIEMGLIQHNAKLFFMGKEDTYRRKLYSYDGRNLVVHKENMKLNWSDFHDAIEMVSYGGSLIFPFIAENRDYGLFSYKENGGFVPLITYYRDRVSDISKVNVIGSRLYFFADKSEVGFEPFLYDVERGLANIADIATRWNTNRGSGFTEFKGKIYFTADNNFNGNELYEFLPASGENVMGAINLLLLND